MFIVFLLFYYLIAKGVPNLILCHLVRFLLTSCHIDCQIEKLNFVVPFLHCKYTLFPPNKKILMIIKKP